MFVFSCVHNKVESVSRCLLLFHMCCMHKKVESISNSKNTTSSDLSKCLGLHFSFYANITFS